MATLIKIILIFGFIIFLISNSKAGTPTDSADIPSFSAFLSNAQYSLLL